MGVPVYLMNRWVPASVPGTLLQIVVGLIFAFVGLVIFVMAVTMGFMPVGYHIGRTLAVYSPKALLAFAFIVGALAPLGIGYLKSTCGLAFGMSLLSLFYLAGAGFIFIAMKFFFLKEYYNESQITH